MNISNKLTQKQLQEILLNICKKADETNEVKVTDTINEIRQSLLSIYSSKANTR